MKLSLTATVLVSAAMTMVTAPVAAQSDSPCVTKSQCDQRADAQAMRERRSAWDANVARENAFRADMGALRAQARADTDTTNDAKVREILRRRRAAAGN